jgi:hypothetical protein
VLVAELKAKSVLNGESANITVGCIKRSLNFVPKCSLNDAKCFLNQVTFSLIDAQFSITDDREGQLLHVP